MEKQPTQTVMKNDSTTNTRLEVDREQKLRDSTSVDSDGHTCARNIPAENEAHAQNKSVRVSKITINSSNPMRTFMNSRLDVILSVIFYFNVTTEMIKK